MEYGHYLYYEDVTSKKFLVPITQPLQRQYLRFFNCNKSGRPELTNWQEYLSGINFTQREKINDKVEIMNKLSGTKLRKIKP